MGRRKEATDGDLLRLAAKRDVAAFSKLYERYEPIVSGFLMRRAGDPELAADLTGETFAAAVLSAPAFRDEGQSAVGWLLGIAHNLLRRARERGHAEQRARAKLGVAAVSYSDASLERVEALADLEATGNPLLAALAALPPGEREAVRAYVLDEQPYADIAERLGVSQIAVRQRVSRGLARLRTRVEGQTP